MNRDDLLKKCADRGVADQGSIEAVSHLFYVYLLSALQKGQRVEVPNFGTFGTRVVGVKRARKMPYFEVEKELADKVNDRYRELKHLVIGRYELSPVIGDEEYKGREMPHDTIVDQVGKEIVVDTQRDVTVEEYERSLASTQSKEKKTMPKLNLKGEGMEEELQPLEEKRTTISTPAMDDMKERSGPSPLLQILIALLLLGGITFGLNQFGIIHLWGKKPAQVTESLPEPEPSVQTETAPPVTESSKPPAEQASPTPATPVPSPGNTATQPPATQTPVKPSPDAGVSKPKPPAQTPGETTPKLSIPTTGSGQFTVQVSSWSTRSKAEAEVNKLTRAGLTAFVADAMVAGEKKYRVRVGHYATEQEAAAAAAQLSEMLENGIWVAKTSKQ